jgi:RNA polymerase sigma factor (sigma-70 family)
MSSATNDLMPTRYSLLSRLKNWEDQTSWRDFFDTYWRLIYEVALKAGLHETEAQEVVQETVIAVAKNIGAFRAQPEHGSFKAWLLHQTRWRIADQFRKRQVCPAPDSRNRNDQSNSNGPRTATIDRVVDPAGNALEALWEQEWGKTLMSRALEAVKQRISPRQFQIFDLHVLQEQSVTQVCAILQVSSMQVYLAKNRVGALLKKELKRLTKAGY